MHNYSFIDINYEGRVVKDELCGTITTRVDNDNIFIIEVENDK